MLLENLLLASYGVHFACLLFLWLYCGGFSSQTFQVESTIMRIKKRYNNWTIWSDYAWGRTKPIFYATSTVGYILGGKDIANIRNDKFHDTFSKKTKM